MYEYSFVGFINQRIFAQQFVSWNAFTSAFVNKIAQMLKIETRILGNFRIDQNLTPLRFHHVMSRLVDRIAETGELGP